MRGKQYISDVFLSFFVDKFHIREEFKCKMSSDSFLYPSNYILIRFLLFSREQYMVVCDKLVFLIFSDFVRKISEC